MLIIWLRKVDKLQATEKKDLLNVITIIRRKQNSEEQDVKTKTRLQDDLGIASWNEMKNVSRLNRNWS